MHTKIIKKGNYIRVDTTTKKRLLFIENNINKFRANQLPGAAKEYKNQQIQLRVRQLKRTELASELEALNTSGCSPVRLTPAVGVTTGAHYRMSTGPSSPTLTHEVRGGPIKAYINPNIKIKVHFFASTLAYMHFILYLCSRNNASSI